jgi:hypothetical protein
MTIQNHKKQKNKKYYLFLSNLYCFKQFFEEFLHQNKVGSYCLKVLKSSKTLRSK